MPAGPTPSLWDFPPPLDGDRDGNEAPPHSRGVLPAAWLQKAQERRQQELEYLAGVREKPGRRYGTTTGFDIP